MPYLASFLVLASAAATTHAQAAPSCPGPGQTSDVDLTSKYVPGGEKIVPRAGVERINRCDVPLYYYPVWQGHDPSPSDPSRELCPNSTHYEPYQLIGEGVGGVSEKYASVPFGSLAADVAVFQFEYSLSTAEGRNDVIWTDLSTIDCGSAGSRGKLGNCPAREGGYVLRFSNDDCNVTLCMGSADHTQPCHEVYSRPDDDQKGMRACRSHGAEFYHAHNTTIVFCPNQDDIDAVHRQRGGRQ